VEEGFREKKGKKEVYYSGGGNKGPVKKIKKKRAAILFSTVRAGDRKKREDKTRGERGIPLLSRTRTIQSSKGPLEWRGIQEGKNHPLTSLCRTTEKIPRADLKGSKKKKVAWSDRKGGGKKKEITF